MEKMNRGGKEHKRPHLDSLLTANNIGTANPLISANQLSNIIDAPQQELNQLNTSVTMIESFRTSTQ